MSKDMDYNYGMSQKDRNTLRDKGPFILRELIIDAIFLAHLKRSGTLNEEREEDIKVLEKRHERNDELLSILCRSGPSAFKNFIFALVETNQRHIAEALILPQNIEQYIKENSMLNYAQCAVHATGHMSAAKSVPVASHSQDLSQLNLSGNAGSARNTEDERDSNFGAENAVSLADGLNDPYGPEILIEAKPLNADVLKKMEENPERYYKMSSCRAIILNNEKFEREEHKDRKGSSVDLNNTRRLFEKYGYDVDVWQDLTADKIKENIKKENENLKSKKFDGFVFVIMSHGSRGYIFGIEGKQVNIENDITEPFDGKNCEVLIGKPKIFLIQACQGKRLSEGFKHCNEPDNEGEALEEPDCWVHEKADMIEFHSTYPGFKALRNTIYGSHFIRSIVRNVYEHGHEEDFYDIMTKVKCDVAALVIPFIDKPEKPMKLKQMPSSQNDTLMGKFYFPLFRN